MSLEVDGHDVSMQGYYPTEPKMTEECNHVWNERICSLNSARHTALRLRNYVITAYTVRYRIYARYQNKEEVERRRQKKKMKNTETILSILI